MKQRTSNRGEGQDRRFSPDPLFPVPCPLIIERQAMHTMTRGAGVHTIPNPRDSGWANEVCGRLVSRHGRKAVAVA